MAEINRIQLKRSAYNSTTAPSSLQAGEIALQQGQTSSIPPRIFVGRQSDNNDPATIAVRHLSTLDDLTLGTSSPLALTNSFASRSSENNAARVLSLGLDDSSIESYDSGSSVYQLRVKALGIQTGMLANSAVTTAKILDDNVTLAKLAHQSAYTVLGVSGTSTAGPSAIAAGAASRVLKRPASGGLTFAQVETADIADDQITNVLMANDSVNTNEIVDDAVTNAKLATVRGKIKTADASGTIDFTASGSNKFIIGDGTDIQSGILAGDVSGAWNSNTQQIDITVNEIGGSGGLSIKGDITSATVNPNWTLQDNQANALIFRSSDGSGGWENIASFDTQNGAERFKVLKDMVVDGNLTVNGTTTNISSSTIVAEDTLIKLNSEATGNTVDTGFYSKYVADEGGGSGTYYRGFVWDQSASQWMLFHGANTEPTTTVDVTNVYFNYDTLQIGSLKGTNNSGGFGSITSMSIDCGTY